MADRWEDLGFRIWLIEKGIGELATLLVYISTTRGWAQMPFHFETTMATTIHHASVFPLTVAPGELAAPRAGEPNGPIFLTDGIAACGGLTIGQGQ